jgi:hypothetical protein
MIGWLREVALIAIIVTIFFSARHMGRQEIELRWDAEKLRVAEQIAREESNYARQLQTARDQAVEARGELDRLRAAPHPRLLCHAAPAVPAPGAAPDAGTAGGGVLPQDAGYDPSPSLYRLADEADDAVVNCREALAKWPR